MNRFLYTVFAAFTITQAVIAAELRPSGPMPPVKIRPGYGDTGYDHWTWEGVAVVQDPVNHETLYLGGRCGGAEFGTLGDWALAADGKTWREMKFADAELDLLRQSAITLRGSVRDSEARARNLFFATLATTQEADAVRRQIAPLVIDALKQAEQLSAALAAAKVQGWRSKAVDHAKSLVQTAIENLQACAGPASTKGISSRNS